MSDDESDVLKGQRFWLKLCSGLMALHVVIFAFLFVEMWDADKDRDKILSAYGAAIAVLESKSKGLNYRVELLESVGYKK